MERDAALGPVDPRRRLFPAGSDGAAHAAPMLATSFGLRSTIRSTTSGIARPPKSHVARTPDRARAERVQAVVAARQCDSFAASARSRRALGHLGASLREARAARRAGDVCRPLGDTTVRASRAYARGAAATDELDRALDRKEAPEGPLVLAGDFNDWRNDSVPLFAEHRLKEVATDARSVRADVPGVFARARARQDVRTRHEAGRMDPADAGNGMAIRSPSVYGAAAGGMMGR